MIKNIPEFAEYFQDYAEDKLPERDYLISIINTLDKNATKKLVKDTRDSRSILQFPNDKNLVEITKRLLKEIQKISSSKSNLIFENMRDKPKNTSNILQS